MTFEAAIVEGITKVTPEAGTIAGFPIEAAPVAALLPEIAVGPDSDGSGRIAGDAAATRFGLDEYRGSGQGADRSVVEATIVEAVAVITPEAAMLAEVPVEVIAVTSKELASAPVEIMVGQGSVDAGGFAGDEHSFGRERDGRREGRSQRSGHCACQKCVHRNILRRSQAAARPVLEPVPARSATPSSLQS